MRQNKIAIALAVTSLLTSLALAQEVGGPGKPWRGAGVPPCFGIDGGANKCPSGPQTIAVRAGRLFDSKTGTLLDNQLVLIQGERITAVGPAGQVPVPAGARIIDLSRQTVLPGLIDLHTHMFNPPKPGMTREMSTLIAMQNIQA